MKRIKVGDIFFLITPNTKQKRFFQFIAKDTSSMSSDVVRVFRRAYNIDYIPTLAEVLEDSVECYLHTMIRWGIYLNVWSYFDNSSNIGSLEISFRSSRDVGAHPGQTFVSYNWEVWELNRPVRFVGRLPKQYYTADIGDVSGPLRAVKEIEEREYCGVYYPKYSQED